jgi:hypothetical protein
VDWAHGILEFLAIALVAGPIAAIFVFRRYGFAQPAKTH